MGAARWPAGTQRRSGRLPRARICRGARCRDCPGWDARLLAVSGAAGKRGAYRNIRSTACGPARVPGQSGAPEVRRLRNQRAAGLGDAGGLPPLDPKLRGAAGRFLVQALSMAEPRNVLFGQPGRYVRRIIVVAPAEHLAAFVYPRQCFAVGQRNIEPYDAAIALEPVIEQLKQRIASLTRRG